MENDYFWGQIKNLQDDYGNILKALLPKLSTEDLPMLIDEINLFWFANRDLVRIILRNISFDNECYTFTGATFLDIDDFEHYPFVALGSIHIIDDPLYKYINITKDIPNKDFAMQLKKQIELSVQDNIKIIENCPGIIYILPVTLLSDLNSDLLRKASEQAFFSMFKGSTITLQKYHSNFKTIEDVAFAIKDNVKKTLVFSEEDDDGDDLINRFKKHASSIHPFNSDTNDAMLFFYTVNGFFTQAFSILLMCAEYNMIPYLRFEVTYKYTVLLGRNFLDNNEMQTILFRSVCAHLLYRIFDKSKITNIEFIHYLSVLKRQNFSNRVFDILQENGINLYKPNISKVTDILHNELNKVFKAASESC